MDVAKQHMHDKNSPTDPKQPFTRSLFIAFRGLAEALATERNLQIQSVIGIIVVGAGWFFRLTTTEWLVVILCIGGVIAAELLNTAIEAVVDLLQPEYHERARHAKDFAAAGVVTVAITATLCGANIFGQHVWTWYTTLN